MRYYGRQFMSILYRVFIVCILILTPNHHKKISDETNIIRSTNNIYNMT